jgi:hypothetical protein
MPCILDSDFRTRQPFQVQWLLSVMSDLNIKKLFIFFTLCIYVLRMILTQETAIRIVRDFRLLLRCRSDLCSSGMLRSVELLFCTDVSGQHIGRKVGPELQLNAA